MIISDKTEFGRNIRGKEDSYNNNWAPPEYSRLCAQNNMASRYLSNRIKNDLEPSYTELCTSKQENIHHSQHSEHLQKLTCTKSQSKSWPIKKSKSYSLKSWTTNAKKVDQQRHTNQKDHSGCWVKNGWFGGPMEQGDPLRVQGVGGGLGTCEAVTWEKSSDRLVRSHTSGT